MTTNQVATKKLRTKRRKAKLNAIVSSKVFNLVKRNISLNTTLTDTRRELALLTERLTVSENETKGLKDKYEPAQLSQESRESLDRGLEDVKAGRVSEFGEVNKVEEA